MDAVNKFKKMVGTALTKLWGAMKQKVCGSTVTNMLYSCDQLTKSIFMKVNVVRLTRRLAPPHGLVLTAAHWNQVAFLVHILRNVKPGSWTNHL